MTGSAESWAAVVVNRDGAVFLEGCLSALFACRMPPSEIVVVDNASSDDSLLDLAGWPQVVVEPSPVDLGYAAAANRGLELTEAPLVALLFPEVVPDATFGAALLTAFNRRPSLALAAPQFRDPEGRLQSAGGILERPLLFTSARPAHTGGALDPQQAADVDFAPATALVLRREAVEAIGGFDEQFWPLAYADVDLALRCRAAGWDVCYVPALTVEVMACPEPRDLPRNRLRLALKHLSHTDWAQRFLPAELERLRLALAAPGSDWPETSGAGAIEALARAGRLSRAASLLDPGPLREAIDRTSEAAAHGRQEPKPARRVLRDPALPAFIEQQRAFNMAVVHALEAQARLSRELTAELLLVMLDLLAPERA